MDTDTDGYVLDQQVGHLLRRANQRHTALFAKRFAAFDLTPLQFAVVMRLREAGPLSQNLLGRETAMDPNTVQGVILRLLRRRLVTRSGSDADKRRKVLALTPEGRALAERLIIEGHAVTEETLAPLSATQRRQFLGLLARLT
jgi:MarR family transcriptional regulator, lower aerobic nicotinate degradation pathway regulator